jgi:hypothetical protein
MSSIKLFAGILLVLVVLFTQVGNVAAAPQIQGTTLITGTVELVETKTDATGVTTVPVTLRTDEGTTQTVRLSVETAVILGLVTLDPITKEPVVVEIPEGLTVEIDPATVLPEESSEESVHPIAWVLGEFFNEDPGVIDGYHQDGFGFGVIAQALWISNNITRTETETGNATLAGEILQAKENKDFQAFFDAHPEYFGEDEVAPINWGQFKKLLQEKKNNLGVVVSGQEEPETTADPTLTDQDKKDHGNGQDKNDKVKKEKKDKKNKP